MIECCTSNRPDAVFRDSKGDNIHIYFAACIKFKMYSRDISFMMMMMFKPDKSIA